MFQNHKLSITLATLYFFLIPLFFLPGGMLSLDMAKAALFSIGTVILALVLIYEFFRAGRLDAPRSYLLLSAILLPVVYFLSAILATPSSLSLFGYGFEAGTFGFMLIGSALLLLAALIFSEASKILQAIAAIFVSLSIIAVFAAVKIGTGGNTLVLGNFAGNMGNPLGGWTDLGIALSLLAVISAAAIGMLPMAGWVRAFVYIVLVLSVVLMGIIGFSTAAAFLLGASVFLFIYFSRVEKKFHTEKNSFFARPTFLPLLLGIISLLLVINPNLSGGKSLSSYISNSFGVNNSEVRPSYSATLGISKAVLSQGGLLGSGPNTFARDWLIYRPANINTTPFWAAAFPFGAGFLPTQVASTGIIGSALWLAFFVLLLALTIKSLVHMPEPRADRFALLSTLTGSLFLWASTFFYAPSSSMLLLSFIFTGLFVASAAHAGVIERRIIETRQSPQLKIASALLLILLVAGAVFVGYTGVKKTISAYHFNKAVALSNTANTPLNDVEGSLIKAINSSPADVYYVALSRLNFARAQAVANSATGTPEENRAVFESSISRSIEAARLAVSTNPAGFENWMALGNVYASLVPKPLQVEGAYENALFAYSEASKRNPSNPEIALLAARLELSKENADNARSYIRQALALKQDYADAYLMLAQLEVVAGNTAAAIASAENLAILVPDTGIFFELGLLKYSAKDYSGAEVSLRKALELSPDYANAKYYLGLTLAEEKKFTEAREQLEDLLRTNPDSAELKAAIEAVKKNKIPEK